MFRISHGVFTVFVQLMRALHAPAFAHTVSELADSLDKSSIRKYDTVMNLPHSSKTDALLPTRHFTCWSVVIVQSKATAFPISFNPSILL